MISGVWHHDQTAVRLTREGINGTLHLGGIAHFGCRKAQPNRRGRGFNCTQYFNLRGLNWIQDSCHTSYARRDLLEYLQPLRRGRELERGEPRKVPAWLC